ncbi:MAG: endo alpha-1,4 polygalactosaminidase [SAR324 cluster bacterium]|nr:endo alpha-1,4 polygalactosaminidase [SAR324 cluster bacterium]
MPFGINPLLLRGSVISLLIMTLFSPARASELKGNQAGFDDSLGPQYAPYAFKGRNYEQNMRRFIISLADYAHQLKPDFLIIPQNGEPLLTDNLEPDGKVVKEYAAVIDGQGREDLNYGYEGDDISTEQSSPQDYKTMLRFLELAESLGVEVLVTDYASTPKHVLHAYENNFRHHWISIVQYRNLDRIPDQLEAPYHENNSDVHSLKEAKNFLYWINPAPMESFLNQIRQSSYDAIIIDLFVDGNSLQREQVESLKTKENGGKRLVIAYMSIGEAEDYRWYWQKQWSTRPPEWLGAENPNWPGNYKVQYWNPAWQSLFYGNEGSYLKKIIDAGFDGVYLDLVDAFGYYKEKRGDWD